MPTKVWRQNWLRIWFKSYYISGFYYNSGSKVTTFLGFTTLLVIYYVSGSNIYPANVFWTTVVLMSVPIIRSVDRTFMLDNVLMNNELSLSVLTFLFYRLLLNGLFVETYNWQQNTSHRLLCISQQFVKRFLAIVFLFVVILSWNLLICLIVF